MNPFFVDVFELCRAGKGLEGRVIVSDLPRLAEEVADKFGTVAWSLRGGKDNFGRSQLTLSVVGEVSLICQRCLMPFIFDVASESRLILAKDELDADEIEGVLHDDSVEVIVGSKALDINTLIEDDVLLTIPLSSKHDVCPNQLLSSKETITKSASPFSVLKV